MQLPIAKTSSMPTEQTLVRYFYQASANWTAHLAESESLDFGTAWSNPQFTSDVGANCMLDVALPSEIMPAQALEQGDVYFASRGVSCWQWVMNPSAPREQTAPMAKYLVARGFRAGACDIMYLDRLAVSPRSAGGQPLQIIPARASFRHARMLYEEYCRGRNNPQLVEAKMLHLDDPHYDALIALQDGVAVAQAGVLAVGEVGMIKDVYVSESLRNRGIGTTMMSRAMEICARSLFKHVLLGVWADRAIAIHLYQRLGFRKTGQWVEYQRPETLAPAPGVG
jgi:GNAT superfamily N-acetyltransferase